MTIKTPQQACAKYGLTSLKEASDITGVKSRVLFKWFTERRAVFDLGVGDACYSKGRMRKPMGVPSYECKQIGLAGLAQVSILGDVPLVDLYKWYVEKPLLLTMILKGAEHVILNHNPESGALSITCPQCKKVSYSAGDIKAKYCRDCGYYEDIKAPYEVKK